MSVDRRGVPVSGADNKSQDGYERALAAFNIYRGDPIALIDDVLGEAPDFVMGHIFRAYMCAGLWERSAVAEIKAGLERLKALAPLANARERAHMSALAD